MKYRRAAIPIAISLAFGGAAYTGAARAQSAQDLQRQIDQLQRQVDSMNKEKGTGQAEPAAPSGRAAAPVTADTTIQLYGHLDLSIHSDNKIMYEGQVRTDGTVAVGKLRWQSHTSSNI